MLSQFIRRGGRTGRVPGTALAIIVLTAPAMGQKGQPVQAARRGEPFELKANETARLADENLSVRLDGVSDDSRCAVGVQCVWAGDAVIELTLEKPPAAAATLTLHTSDRYGRQAAYEGVIIRLLDLKPLPKEGTTIAPEDYRATLVVDKDNQARGVAVGSTQSP